MSDYIFVNYQLAPGETIGNNQRIPIGNGIIRQSPSAVISRNSATELRFSQSGTYLVTYTVTDFNTTGPRIELVVQLDGVDLTDSFAMGGQSFGIASASTSLILSVFSGDILSLSNHSTNLLTNGCRTNLTILRIDNI